MWIPESDSEGIVIYHRDPRNRWHLIPLPNQNNSDNICDGDVNNPIQSKDLVNKTLLLK